MHISTFKYATLGTFDVREANESVINGQVCLDIKYVRGHEPDPRSSVAFWCSITRSYVHNATILGSSGCITVDPHPAYDILITDEDAKDEIDKIAAVTITGVFVPNTTTTPSVTAQPPIPIIITIIVVSKFIVRKHVKQYNEHAHVLSFN